MQPVSSSPFGTQGLYRRDLPDLPDALVANHLRACLDLIASAQYGSAQGMRDNFLDDPKTTPFIFEAVWDKLRETSG